MFDGPFGDMFDFDHDGELDPNERMAEYMLYREITGDDDDDDDNYDDDSDYDDDNYDDDDF